MTKLAQIENLCLEKIMFLFESSINNTTETQNLASYMQLSSIYVHQMMTMMTPMNGIIHDHTMHLSLQMAC